MGMARARMVWVAAGLALVAVVACLWWRATQPPAWVSWEQRTIACDLDGDGFEELVSLAERRVTVVRADSTVADETPEHWQVSDVWVGDVTHDGTPDLVLLMWRRGDYGTHHPFWDEGTQDVSQHLCVLTFADGGLRLTWESSSFGFEVTSMSLDDAGDLHLVRRDTGEESVWHWPGWGFERVTGQR